jgi:glycosyltransferase involved in cell wall biosynthesis
MAAIGSLGTGGSEKQLVELLVRIPRERFDPVLVTLQREDDGSSRHFELLREASVRVMSLGVPRRSAPSRLLRVLSRYLRVLDTVRPDLVYAWLDETAAYLAPICRAKGIPCLVARRNVIGSASERRNSTLGRLIRLAETSATLVTANSAAVAAACVQRGHAPDRVRLVSNGHEHVPALPSPESPPTVFGYVAQFRPEKGHHRLIDTLVRMPAGRWRVDLAGAGVLRAEIEARVKAARLSDQVEFVGEVADARKFWRERHVAVLLSDSEGMPNALLEAAFAGRPVIATRTGGIPEVVGDRGGLLVPLDDPAQTAAQMAALLEDPSRREAMGKAIWEHVTGTYSIERMVGDHVRAIEEAYQPGAGQRARAVHRQ